MSARARRPAARPPRPPARAFPAPRWAFALAAIGLLALLWRLGWLHRVDATPLAGALAADASTYWRWAGELRAHGPLGHNAFFLGALYPYVLAALRTVLGDDSARVLVVQALWGALACVLLADAARRLTRPALGIAVGLWAALAEMPVFFDGLVLGESLLFALGALLAWAIVVASARPARPAAYAALGALVGIMAQGRANEAVLLAPLGALALARGRTATGRARSLAALLGAFALVCLPTALRNRAVSGEWIPFTYNGGYNLYVGNNPDANGGFVGVTGTYDITPAADAAAAEGGAEADGRDYLARAEGLRLSPAASSARWATKARAWIAAHPGRAFALAARKLAMAWNWREQPQIENVDEFRAVAGPPGLPWLGRFALVALLAFAGLVPAWRAGAAGRVLVGAAAALSLSLVPFFVTDRYRLQLVPAAALLAAFGADALLAAARRTGPWRGALAGLACGAVLLVLPVPHLGAARYACGLAADLGERFLAAGRVDEAATWLERAVRMDERGEVRWGAAPGESLQRAGLWADQARVLLAEGRAREARAAAERAIALAPHSRAVRGVLARALAATGDATRAEALAADAGADASPLAAGRTAARAGDLARAEQLFRDATVHAPREGRAWGALVRIEAQRGEVAAARASLEQGRAAGWSGPSLAVHAALVLALEGDLPRARAAIAALPREQVDADPELADVARVAERLVTPRGPVAPLPAR